VNRLKLVRCRRQGQRTFSAVRRSLHS
jgi:hypothetical protein